MSDDFHNPAADADHDVRQNENRVEPPLPLSDRQELSSPEAGRSSTGSGPAEHQHTQQQVEDLIGRKEARRLRARNEQHQRVWFGLGMFGLVGWSVAIPTLLGTALGMWIDARWDGQQSWTLMLLFGGLFLGCLNAWRWLRDESEVR